MARNPLFLAVTRPALFAGVPIEAAVVVLLASVITLIGTSNPVYGAVVAAVSISGPTGRVNDYGITRLGDLLVTELRGLSALLGHPPGPRGKDAV